jgi:WD40 repeat protein
LKGKKMQTKGVTCRRIAPVLIWLASSGCESSPGLESPELTSGTLTLFIETSGGRDAATYDVEVDDSIHITAAPNDTITVYLGPQHHGFIIRGLGRCTRSPDSPISPGFQFTNGQTKVTFTTYIRCPFAPLHGRIVFDGRGPDGGFTLYAVRPDGTDRWTLLDQAHFGYVVDPWSWFVNARVSPDGRRLATAVLATGPCCPDPGHIPGPGGIAVISGDSFTVVHLPLDFSVGHDWSPDGTRIVATGQGDGKDLYLENPDGSDRRRLTADPGDESFPSWSTDGRRIAFVRDCDIAVIDTAGTAEVVFPSEPYCETGPAWSPDGQLLAFVRMEQPGAGFPSTHGVLYVMNPDGIGERLVVAPPSPFVLSKPAWSPDGKQLAFGTNGTVWVVNADGTDLRPIAGWGNSTPSPHWVR